MERSTQNNAKFYILNQGITQVSGLSFLTPVNILIKNYCMKKVSKHHFAECIDHD